jgi:alkylation response protein AidB-like acyl-CoA dehydrogenase
MLDAFISNLGAENVAFRDEVRAFYDAHLTPELRRAGEATLWALSDFAAGKEWQKILFAKRWGAPEWPLEYGGTGWSATERLIWEVETALHRPPVPMRMGRTLCAPAVIAFGTARQKQSILPPILAGDDWWAQGYSEPGAGSDLASVELKAERDGECLVLNGSKIWTTYAQFANRMFALVRTSSDQANRRSGLTFLLLDMASPGIDVRPIRSLHGAREFNQVFFTDVHVDRAGILGAENDGWLVAKHVMSIAQGGYFLTNCLEYRRRVEEIKTIARQESSGYGAPLIEDPAFSRAIARLEVAVIALEAGALKLLNDDRPTANRSSLMEMFAIRGLEIGQSLTELAVDALGYYGIPWHDDGGHRHIGPDYADFTLNFFLAQRAATIAGGSIEVRRNNVARHSLDL